MYPEQLKECLGDDFDIPDRNHDKGGSSEIAKVTALRDVRGENIIKEIKKGSVIAIKSPSAEKSIDNCNRFFKEIEILKKINNSQYLIEYYGYKTNKDGVPILFLEFAEHDLTHLRRSNDNPSEELMEQIIERVCKGLSVIHKLKNEKGEYYFHRDIKPSNILIFNENLCKIGDFGSVGIYDAVRDDPNEGRAVVSSYGGIHGTPNYAAPETLNLKKERNLYSIQSDLYSVGLVAFYLIAGQTPFDPVKGLTSDINLLKRAKLSNDADREFKRFLDDAVEELIREKVSDNKVKAIRRAIDGDPRKRHSSIDEFLYEYSGHQIPVNLVDTLEVKLRDITESLNQSYSSMHGATPAEIVDKILSTYEEMKDYEKLHNISSEFTKKALDLINKRAREDYFKLGKYIDDKENGIIGRMNLPEDELEKIRNLAALLHSWPPNYGFVSPKHRHKGRMNKEEFEELIRGPDKNHGYLK